MAIISRPPFVELAFLFLIYLKIFRNSVSRNRPSATAISVQSISKNVLIKYKLQEYMQSANKLKYIVKIVNVFFVQK